MVTLTAPAANNLQIGDIVSWITFGDRQKPFRVYVMVIGEVREQVTEQYPVRSETVIPVFALSDKAEWLGIEYLTVDFYSSWCKQLERFQVQVFRNGKQVYGKNI